MAWSARVRKVVGTLRVPSLGKSNSDGTRSVPTTFQVVSGDRVLRTRRVAANPARRDSGSDRDAPGSANPGLTSTHTPCVLPQSKLEECSVRVSITQPEAQHGQNASSLCRHREGCHPQ